MLRTFGRRAVLFLLIVSACGPDDDGVPEGTPAVAGTASGFGALSSDPFDGIPGPEGLAYEDTVESLIWPDGQHVRITVGAHRYRTLVMSVTESGAWTFSARTGLVGADACYQDLPTLIVGTYWRDHAVPDDPWHFWPGGGPVCWPMSVIYTRLYAGGADIEFAFTFGNWADSPADVHADFVP